MKAAIYARVSTFDQEPENQLAELRRYADYADARGWTATAYVDKGVSGAKDKRPALDQLVADARRRRFDVWVVWRLDRLGRNLRHLILLLDELRDYPNTVLARESVNTWRLLATNRPLRRSPPALDSALMGYALSIAILSMLPSTSSGALSRIGSLEKHSASGGSSRFHQSSADEKQLLMIQQQLALAWVERDRAFIERVLAPEWSVTQADGTIRSRSAVLHDAFVVRTVTVESMIVDEVTVTLLGDTAIVRGRTQATGVVGDQRGSARLRFTDTFIKRRGQWQAVASHATALAR
jgi:hypothetical protein